MSLIDTPIVDFVKTLNRETLVALDSNQLLLSPVYPDEADPRIVQLRLTTTGDYQYRGSEVLTYERLDLAYLDTLLFIEPTLYPDNDTLYEILQELTDGVGIRLGEEDVFDAPIVETQGVFLVDLIAKPGSYRWFGQYQLRFRDLPRLSNIIDYEHITW